MRAVGVLLTATLAIGCTHSQLERSTNDQVSTLSDLQTQQVLDNVARFVRNPDGLPYFALTTGGTAQVTDTGTATETVIPNAVPLLNHSVWSGQYGVMGSRAIQENWNVQPITDPAKLKRMRCAYQLLVGAEAHPCDECGKRLQDFYCADECKKGPEACEHCMECWLPRGWFHVGCRKDVPKDACHVGRCRDTYVWVMPDGVDGLAHFTMAILDIATVVPADDNVQVKRIYDGPWVANKEPVTTEVIHAEPAQPPVSPSTQQLRRPAKNRIMPFPYPPTGILPVPAPR